MRILKFMQYAILSRVYSAQFTNTFNKIAKAENSFKINQMKENRIR